MLCYSTVCHKAASTVDKLTSTINIYQVVQGYSTEMVSARALTGWCSGDLTRMLNTSLLRGAKSTLSEHRKRMRLN